MPGKRTHNPDLSGYPYLDREGGRYYIRHPRTRRRASLKTRDFARAVSRWQVIMARWQAEQGDHVASALADKMGAMASAPTAGKAVPTVADYAAEWRDRWLNVRIGQSERGKHGKSKYIQLPCRVISEHTRKHLSDRTAMDYARMCDRFFERDPAWHSLPLNAMNAAQHARKALARYNDKPTSYNHLLACLVTMLQQARRDGHINTNWAREIEPLIKPAKSAEEKALQHIDAAAYQRIRAQIVQFEYHGQPRDGEWLGRACDLLLCMSSRPSEAVGLRDDAFDDQGLLKYRAHKTGTNIEIEDVAGTLAATVLWFRAWKRRNNIISPFLIVYPNYFTLSLAGKPVPMRYISRQFSRAVVDAGYPKGRWVFRNLRHTGITEEEKASAGANKGAHKSRAGQAHYLTTDIATRVKNTIKGEYFPGDDND